MFCGHCNLEFAETEPFCPNCGASCGKIQNQLHEKNSGFLPSGTVLENKYIIDRECAFGTGRLYQATELHTGRQVLLEVANLREGTGSGTVREHAECLQEVVPSAIITTTVTGQDAESQLSPADDFSPPLSLRERFELLSSLERSKDGDYFVSDGREYLVIEPPKGRNIVALAAEGNVTEDLAVEIAIGLCQCVAEIHRRGYLHLNIEPNTIYVCDGQVSLSDFSRATKQGWAGQDYLTTDGFSAPELMLPDEGAVDARADIYSIGTVLLWMLSGEKVALAGVSRQKVTDAVSHPELARILLLCLAADAKFRYKTVDELKEKLQSFQVLKRRLHCESAALTDIGMMRANNEDSCFLLEFCQTSNSQADSCGIYLVADGMGGHEAGEVASGKAAEIISLSILDVVNSLERRGSFTEVVKQAIEKANKEIYTMAQSSPRLSSMGTTVTLGLRVNNELYLGHVGDSRCYLIRDGVIKRLTRDHSVVGGLLERGIITPEQARLHPDRGKIYRCLGSAADVPIDTCETTDYGERVVLQSGDKLIFCSDGLTNDVQDEDILEFTEKEEGMNSQSICQSLVNLANRRGGEDNISVIVVKVSAGNKKIGGKNG